MNKSLFGCPPKKKVKKKKKKKKGSMKRMRLSYY